MTLSPQLPSTLNQPAIILVKPQLSENIGKTARAMLNFGLTELRLVQPMTTWLNDAARRLCAGADAVLDQAQVFDDFESAIADINRLYATSARPRDMIKDVFTPQHVAQEAVYHYNQNQKIGFLFGPEQTGLHNTHVMRADALISIPVNPHFSSLNLAQAVIIQAYEWHQALMNPDPFYQVKGRSDTGQKEELTGLVDHLNKELLKAGYYRTIKKQLLMQQNLTNILSRCSLTSQEIQTLRGVISTLTNPRGLFSKRRPRSLKTD